MYYIVLSKTYTNNYIFLQSNIILSTYRYNEGCDYNFKDSISNPGKVTGHFTQLVWKPTKEFGIGYATGINKHDTTMKCIYVVARYKPAGNILGQFSTNVGGPLSEVQDICSKYGGFKPLHSSKLEDSDIDRISSNTSAEDEDTKLYESNDDMTIQDQASQEKLGALYGLNDDLSIDGTRRKPLKTKLYESNVNNMDVSSEMSDVPMDNTISEQQTSDIQSGMDFDRNTEDESFVADGAATPTHRYDTSTGMMVSPKQESSLNQAGMNSAATSPDISSEDTLPAKGVTGTTANLPPLTTSIASAVTAAKPSIPASSSAISAKEECKRKNY